jgi:hypothetical protein
MYIWRPNRALDFKDPDVIFGSQKIKKKVKLVGIPQDVDVSLYRDQRYYFKGVLLHYLIRLETERIK